MTARAEIDHTLECGTRNFSLTPDFSPVITRSREWEPFKRLLPYGCAGTRLKPGVNEK
jgi:hypothetical protein